MSKFFTRYALVAVVMALGVLAFVKAANADHTLTPKFYLSTEMICFDPDVVLKLVEEPDPVAQNELWTQALLFDVCLAMGWMSLTFHEVYAEAIWAADDEATPMVIIGAADASGRMVWLWAVKELFEKMRSEAIHGVEWNI